MLSLFRGISEHQQLLVLPGVLADEMGLGKTIQVCALLNGARKAGKTHALLLMPVTLLDQLLG